MRGRHVLDIREARPGQTILSKRHTPAPDRFKNIHGHDVPVLITTPAGEGPFRTVLLLHGFGGNKEEGDHACRNRW